MGRFIAFLAIVLVTGCKPGTSDPPPPVAPADAEIKFENWPTVTDHPIIVNWGRMVLDCATPGGSPELRRLREAAEKRHGPHYKPAIVVRTNPEALTVFRSGASPLPVGTTIVKEKHSDSEANGPPSEYGAMVKREAGYDAVHGDWEYVYVVRQPEKKITRGRLQTCIECHTTAAGNDYLFRTYLPKP